MKAIRKGYWISQGFVPETFLYDVNDFGEVLHPSILIWDSEDKPYYWMLLNVNANLAMGFCCDASTFVQAGTLEGLLKYRSKLREINLSILDGTQVPFNYAIAATFCALLTRTKDHQELVPVKVETSAGYEGKALINKLLDSLVDMIGIYINVEDLSYSTKDVTMEKKKDVFQTVLSTIGIHQ